MNYKLLQQSIASLLLVALISSCASSTLIQSVPTGAKLFIDGSLVGKTPYRMRDTKITGASTSIRIESEGYEPLFTIITKDEEVNPGAVIGGFFFLFPFLWTMQYQPWRNYELQKKTDSFKAEPLFLTTSAVERIRELKKLLDEGIITKEEFEKGKRKILE